MSVAAQKKNDDEVNDDDDEINDEKYDDDEDKKFATNFHEDYYDPHTMQPWLLAAMTLQHALRERSQTAPCLEGKQQQQK